MAASNQRVRLSASLKASAPGRARSAFFKAKGWLVGEIPQRSLCFRPFGLLLLVDGRAPADGIVGDAHIRHLRGIIKVAAVKDYRIF